MTVQFSDIEVKTALSIFNSLPDYVCWKNADLEYVMVNDVTANLFGFDSSNISFKGISDFDLKCDAANLAEDFRRDDDLVLNSGKNLTIINYCRYEKDEWKLLFGRKSQMKDENGDVKGVFARFLDVTDCPLMGLVYGLAHADDKILGGDLNKVGQVNYIVQDKFDDLGLSHRESEVLFFLIRGKTAKEIARVVGLSNRTVEKHLDRIKNKLNCCSRSELIEKALASGIGAYVPTAITKRFKGEIS